jgi:NosR/NirI family nitrous oxide reductase transcriptional regulator
MGLWNYFNWLQFENPTGKPHDFPELSGGYESSVPGIYCIGDLTGIPLIQLAAESGVEIVQTLKADTKFKPDALTNDIIIIGAGPAGLSAAIEAQKEGLSCIVLEASTEFNTLKNFPAEKPILNSTYTKELHSRFRFTDGTKETLLDEFASIMEEADLSIEYGVNVQSIHESKDGFTLKSSQGEFSGKRVIVAIGVSGNSRKLKVEGEDLPKVFNRLVDPKEFSERNILVVGGGDSAIEGAVALAQNGNRVSLSYRKDSFSRPKENNLLAFNKEVDKGTITPYFSSTVQSISEKEVTLKTSGGVENINNDTVFTMIGTEIPIQFFKRSNIKIENEKNGSWWIQLITMITFFSMLYFGKSGTAYDLIHKDSIAESIASYLLAPFQLNLPWGLQNGDWYGSLNFLLGWGSSLLFFLFGTVALVLFFKKWKTYTNSLWNKIKYGYIIGVSFFFTAVYFNSLLGTNAGWVEEPTYWYSLLYCTTMLLFGIRRVIVTPTKYVRIQTAVLVFIQITFLFLLPFYLFDGLIKPLFSADSWVITQLFPQGKWSSFGFILFWPLNMANFGTSTFWTYFPIFQTFIFLPIIVYLWGKGAYCGWICSCGGMAETLGDEYRKTALHGPMAKKWENLGQFVLLFALVATILHELSSGAISGTAAGTVWKSYKFLVDIIFAGVLGLGVYFFFSGRVWCRFMCPLAALMHIYSRFSRFRILSKKEFCISCNICTKACHMGIDVMNYANKGKPMDDVQCVACSTCITSCPRDVLWFKRLKEV